MSRLTKKIPCRFCGADYPYRTEDQQSGACYSCDQEIRKISNGFIKGGYWYASADGTFCRRWGPEMSRQDAEIEFAKRRLMAAAKNIKSGNSIKNHVCQAMANNGRNQCPRRAVAIRDGRFVCRNHELAPDPVYLDAEAETPPIIGIVLAVIATDPSLKEPIIRALQNAPSGATPPGQALPPAEGPAGHQNGDNNDTT